MDLHYSRTCEETEEDVHLEELNKLEGVHVSLQESCHLLHWMIVSWSVTPKECL